MSADRTSLNLNASPLRTSFINLVCFFVAAMTLTGLVGCGDKSDSNLSSLSTPRDPGTPIVVVMGGYMSCKYPLNTPYSLSMYPKARAFINELSAKSGKQARFVITCFHTATTEMRYFSSDNAKQMRITHPDNLNKLIMEQVGKTEVHSLYLIGHSYGGWNVIRAAATLPAQVNILSIATIDPISMRNCKPEVFAKAYLRSMLRFDPAGGCTEAPADLRPQFKSIASRVGRWQHVYQDDYGYLHSSGIAEATSSHRIKMKVNWLNSFRAHIDIDSDDRTWSPISISALSDYSNVSPVKNFAVTSDTNASSSEL